MADEMIRFNGFPFLEKEDKEDGDHAFIEPSELPSILWCSQLTSSRERHEERYHFHGRFRCAFAGDR